MTTKLSLSELLERAKTEKLAIHTPTEAQAKTLLKAFDKMGKRWRDGSSYLEIDYFGKEKENTCYSNHREYCHKQWYEEHGYAIYDYSEVDLSK